MIEKFSDEELKQIMKELGVSTNTTKACICRQEIEELRKLWSQKPYNDHSIIFRLVDVALCNFEKRTKKNSVKGKPYYGKEYEVDVICRTVKQEDKEEYRQMFKEIVEIIKKHNRKWEGGID